ncbi:hypothetical protein D3C85_1894250 [compost metagenome]
MIAGLGKIKVIADTRTQGCYNRSNLGIAKYPVKAGLLYIQDLTSQRKNCLEVTVTSLLG